MITVNHSAYLSNSALEKYRLFRDITTQRAYSLTSERLIDKITAHQQIVEEVNLKQIASATERNYGSIYNTYLGLTKDLEAIKGHEELSVAEMFGISLDQYHFNLVEESHAYAFLRSLLYQEDTSFTQLWQRLDTSKATMLRHTKTLRDFARRLGLRISYDPLMLTGEELNIRLFFFLMFWEATNGYAWPFKFDHDQSLAILEGMRKEFQMEKATQVTAELGAYLIAISYQRMTTKHILTDERLAVLHFPFPDIIPVFEAESGENFHLTPEQALAESSGYYFKFHAVPNFILTDQAKNQENIARYQRYNTALFDLVRQFLAQIPLNMDQLIGTDETRRTNIMSNLLNITLGAMVLGPTVVPIMRLDTTPVDPDKPASPELWRSINSTLTHLVVLPQYQQFQTQLETLSLAYYYFLAHALIPSIQKMALNVSLSLEQNDVSYVDLLGFLTAIPFVRIMSPQEDLDQCAVLLTATDGLYPDAGEDTIVYRLPTKFESDGYGKLYAILMQAWKNKSALNDHF